MSSRGVFNFENKKSKLKSTNYYEKQLKNKYVMYKNCVKMSFDEWIFRNTKQLGYIFLSFV
jgi:hypothetical protein